MPITVSNLGFAYGERVIFTGLSCQFDEAKITGVVGPSGSGKSTLLAVLVGAETAIAGTVSFPPTLLVDNQLARHRIAWMTQTTNLMLRRTALDNVMLPLRSRGMPTVQARERAIEGLVSMGLGNHLHQPCSQLSGGERQRVAMARALVAGVPLLIADEPTSSLDRGNRELLLAGLRTVAEGGAIVIVATHDPEVVAGCDEIVDLVAVQA